MSNNAGIQKIAAELARLRRQVNGLASAPQLGKSSLEAVPGNSIDVTNPTTGNPSAIFGTAPDGSHGAYPLSGPEPPTPTTPLLAGAAGTLTAAWDGVFVGADGEPDITVTAPLDFTYVEVHASQDPALTGLLADTLIGTLVTPRGASITARVVAGQWWVRLVTRSAAGKASPASAAAAATVEQPVDPGEVQAELTRLDQDLTQAGQDIIAVNTRIDTDVAAAIDEAAASPITDSRLQEGSLTVWPFADNTIPAGTVGSTELKDFSILVTKFNDRRHHLY